ncbi:hypothetical protein A2U01_0095977, partial [Trifolium medium]|nr:hypothetical protein [Trifolium medium]
SFSSKILDTSIARLSPAYTPARSTAFSSSVTVSSGPLLRFPSICPPAHEPCLQNPGRWQVEHPSPG